MSEMSIEGQNKSPSEELVDEILRQAELAAKKNETRREVNKMVQRGEQIAEGIAETEKVAKAREQARNLAHMVAERNGLDMNSIGDKWKIVEIMNEIREEGSGPDDDMSEGLKKLKKYLEG